MRHGRIYLKILKLVDYIALECNPLAPFTSGSQVDATC